ncbi:MAG: tyrosine-type recombinase/integrase [Microcoleaceae cyanobacterium]
MAKRLSAEMERDYLNGNFDVSLNKYKRKATPIIKQPKALTLVELSLMYWESQKPTISPNYEKAGFGTMHNHLARSPYAEIVPDANTSGWAQGLFDWSAASRLSPDTRKRLLQYLNRCLEWAIAAKRVKLQRSPFEGMASKIRLHRTRAKSNAKPFTQDEVRQILIWFAEHRTYRHYQWFMAFLFATGCRHNEAQALWDDTVSFTRKTVTFTHRMVNAQGGRQRLSGLKSQPERTIYMNDQIKNILSKAKDSAVNQFVFPSIKGFAIDPAVFGEIWHKCLAELGIEDRNPNQTRHTFASLCAKQGMPPVELAEIMGNKPQTAIDNYVASVGETFIPEFNF